MSIHEISTGARERDCRDGTGMNGISTGMCTTTSINQLLDDEDRPLREAAVSELGMAEVTGTVIWQGVQPLKSGCGVEVYF